MAKAKTQFVCSDCNHTTAKWAGKCPGCQAWNTLVEEEVTKAPQNPRMAHLLEHSKKEKPERLKDIEATQDLRITIDLDEFMRVMGGGIVRDSLNVLTAPPGAGKSTLLTMVANMLGLAGYIVAYFSGEESKQQVRLRTARICPDISENVWFNSESNMNTIRQQIEEINPDVIIMDSIQMAYLDQFTQSPGTPTQVIECTKVFKQIAKKSERPRAVFLVGHMTKDDELGGTRTFEHEVDAVFYLEGDRTDQLRTFRSTKNRFGDAMEIGYFQMLEEGLMPIDNPSEFFMTKRDEPIPGSSLAVIRDGTRNIVVEIETLLEKTPYGIPTRVGEGINKQQLQIMTAILEKRGKLNTSEKDVYAKVVAGMKLQEPSVNLAIIMSMVSSILNKGIPTDTVFVGEVGLTGEIKTVPFLESRIKEVDRLGFKRMFIPKKNLRSSVMTKNVKLIEVGTISEAIAVLTKEISNHAS